MRTRLLRNSLVGLLLCATPAWAQSPSTGTLVHLLSHGWATLDPANAFDSVSFTVTGNVYETLISFKSVDALDEFQPWLARQVPTVENGLLSKDGTVYSFPIRPGVLFHDGSPLKASDVRYSLLRFMLTDYEGGPAPLLLRPILGVKSTRGPDGKIAVDFREAAEAVKVEGEKVVIRLKRPDNTFLKALASLPLVTSQRWAASVGDWDGKERTWKKFNNRAPPETALHGRMNGTGPFKLEKTDDKERRLLVLSRHSRYWRDPAALERVVVRAEPSGGLRLFMMEAGDADSAQLEASHRSYALAARGIQVVDSGSARAPGEMVFFGFKTEGQDNDLLGSGALDGRGIPPDFFADPDVRLGFAYALDYGKLLKVGCALRGQRMVGPFPASLVGAGGPPAYERDAARATEALRRAFGGALWEKGFVLPVAYTSDRALRQITAETLKASLEGLNPKFRIHLHPMPPKEFYQDLEDRRLPLYIDSYYPDYPDAQSLAFGLLHSGGYFPKHQGYSSREADELVERAPGLSSLAERLGLYRRLAEVAARDIPQLYTYSLQEFKACRDRVLGCDSKDNVNNLNFNNFPYFYSLSKK